MYFNSIQNKSNIDVIIYYHNDPDGYVAGLVAALKMKEYDLRTKLIKYSHGSNLETKDVKPGVKIIIVDIPYFPAVAETVGEENVTWIDHHKSSIEDFDSKEIPGIRSRAMSGCELAYLYFYGCQQDIDYVKSLDPLEPHNTHSDIIRMKAPTLVKYIGIYDNWNFEEVLPDALPFFTALSQTRPLDNFGQGYGIWKKLYSDCNMPVIRQDTIEKGNIILSYNYGNDAKVTATNGCPCKIKGFEKYKAIICNTSTRGSLSFSSVKDKYEIGIMYTIDKVGCVNLSLYVINGDPKIDASEICKKFGGGGHPGAGGFKLDKYNELMDIVSFIQE